MSQARVVQLFSGYVFLPLLDFAQIFLNRNRITESIDYSSKKNPKVGVEPVILQYPLDLG